MITTGGGVWSHRKTRKGNINHLRVWGEEGKHRKTEMKESKFFLPKPQVSMVGPK